MSQQISEVQQGCIDRIVRADDLAFACVYAHLKLNCPAFSVPIYLSWMILLRSADKQNAFANLHFAFRDSSKKLAREQSQE